MAVRLIAGIGNPGPDYAETRHNVGHWFIERLADQLKTRLERETRFSGFVGRVEIEKVDVRLLIPTTYMNNSGVAVGAIAHFFRIPPAEILVAQDEVAFAPGVVKLKQGGGHNGHNGLQDIIRGLGNDSNFLRLRIGVGHPGDKNQVSHYLTSQRTPKGEKELIVRAIERSLEVVPDIVAGRLAGAMNRLHAA